MQNNPSLIELPTNDNVYLTNDTDYKDKCTEDCIYVSSDSILRLNKKDRIYLDYKIELAVERVGEYLILEFCHKRCIGEVFVTTYSQYTYLHFNHHYHFDTNQDCIQEFHRPLICLQNLFSISLVYNYGDK